MSESITEILMLRMSGCGATYLTAWVTTSAIRVSNRRLKSAHNGLHDSGTSNERSFNSLLLKFLKWKSQIKSPHHLLSCQMDLTWHAWHCENGGHPSQGIIPSIFTILMLGTASVGILPIMLKLKQRKLFTVH